MTSIKASGRIELTIRNLYDGLPVRRVAPCDGLEVRRTGKFISAARLKVNRFQRFQLIRNAQIGLPSKFPQQFLDQK